MEEIQMDGYYFNSCNESVLYHEVKTAFNQTATAIDMDFGSLNSKRFDDVHKEKIRKGLVHKVKFLASVVGEMKELEFPEADCKIYQQRLNNFRNKMFYLAEYGFEAEKVRRINCSLRLALRMENYEDAAELKKMLDSLLASHQPDIKL
jgi:hypothetical protein